MLQHDCALRLFVEGKNGVAAKVLHRPDQFEADFARHQVTMESLSAERTSHGAIRADQPQIKPKLLCDGQGEREATASDQHDFDARSASAQQSAQVDLRNLEYRRGKRAA